MTTVTISARGPAAPDEVWERYARPARWPQWSPQIRGVDVPVERLSTGTRGRVIGPLGVAATFLVERWDDATMRWSWQVWFGPLTLRLDHGVDARGTGSSTFLTVHGPLPVVLGYLPVARFALWRLVRATG